MVCKMTKWARHRNSRRRLFLPPPLIRALILSATPLYVLISHLSHHPIPTMILAQTYHGAILHHCFVLANDLVDGACVKKYTPAGLSLSIRITGFLGYGNLDPLHSSQTSESGYSKTRKISVSAMDGLLVGRRERFHSGVLNGEYVDSCAPPQKSCLQSQFRLATKSKLACCS